MPRRSGFVGEMSRNGGVECNGPQRTRALWCLLVCLPQISPGYATGKPIIRRVTSAAGATFFSKLGSIAKIQATQSDRKYLHCARSQNYQQGPSHSTGCSSAESTRNFDVMKSDDIFLPEISPTSKGLQGTFEGVLKDVVAGQSLKACTSPVNTVEEDSKYRAQSCSVSSNAHGVKSVRLDGDAYWSDIMRGATENRKSMSMPSDVVRHSKFSDSMLATLAKVQCEAGMLEDALESVKQIRHYRNGRRRFLYNDLLCILVKSYHPQKAHWMYKRMLAAGYRPDACTFNILLSGFGKAGNVGMMKHLLRDMKKKSCNPSAVTYGILVDVMCKVGRVDEAFALFNLNKRVVNVVVYNAMLHGLGKAGRVEQALKLFREMREISISPQVNTCNIVIQSLGIANRPEQAFSFFKEMCSLGVAPDLVTYNLLLKILVRQRLLDRALNLLEDMTNSKCLPDLVSYGTVMSGLGETGDVDKARVLFQRIRLGGLKPNGRIYGAFIGALCKGGKLDEGITVYKGMKLAGYIPDEFVSTVICGHLFQAGRIDEARWLFEEMGTKNNRTYVVSYNIAMHVLGKSGELDRLLKLFQEMSSSGCKPDVITYNTVMVHLGKGGFVDGACKLFREMQAWGCSPDVVSYSILINVFCKQGRSSEALELFQGMRGKGVVPNLFTYGSLIKGLCKAGQFDAAHLVYKEMIDQGCPLNEVAYRTVIQSFSSSMNFVDESYNLFKEMTEKGYQSNALTSYLLRRALRKAGRAEEVEFVKLRSSDVQKVRQVGTDLPVFA